MYISFEGGQNIFIFHANNFLALREGSKFCHFNSNSTTPLLLGYKWPTPKESKISLLYCFVAYLTQDAKNCQNFPKRCTCFQCSTTVFPKWHDRACFGDNHQELFIFNAECIDGVECVWVRNIFQQICMGAKYFPNFFVWVRNNFLQIWSKTFGLRSISGIYS